MLHKHQFIQMHQCIPVFWNAIPNNNCGASTNSKVPTKKTNNEIIVMSITMLHSTQWKPQNTDTNTSI